jgi:hypothetical protein
MAKTSKKLQLKKQTRTTKQLRKTRKITKKIIGGEPGMFRKIAKQILGNKRVEAIKDGLKERGVIRTSEETINDKIIELYKTYICRLLLRSHNIDSRCLNTDQDIIKVVKMYLYILILNNKSNTIKQAINLVKENLYDPNNNHFYSINDKYILVRSTNIENFTALFNALQEKHINNSNTVYDFLTNYKQLPQFRNNIHKKELRPYLDFVEKIDTIYNKLYNHTKLTQSDIIDIYILRQTINENQDNDAITIENLTGLINTKSGLGGFNKDFFKRKLMYILNQEEPYQEEEPAHQEEEPLLALEQQNASKKKKDTISTLIDKLNLPDVNISILTHYQIQLLFSEILKTIYNRQDHHTRNLIYGFLNPSNKEKIQKIIQKFLENINTGIRGFEDFTSPNVGRVNSFMFELTNNQEPELPPVPANYTYTNNTTGQQFVIPLNHNTQNGGMKKTKNNKKTKKNKTKLKHKHNNKK